MRLLSDSIEDFIKTLMEDETREIELRRNELAEHFQCAPSLYQRIGTSISGGDAARIIEHLKMEKIVSPDEAALMLAALSPQAVPLPLAMKDALCAGTLRSMILALAKRRA